MKKNIIIISVLSLFFLQNCKKEEDNPWKVEIKKPAEDVNIIDISKKFYDPNVTLEEFKKDFDWYQGTVPDEDYALRRKDPLEIKIYNEAISKINMPKLKTDLHQLFSHIKNYYPDFKSPKVYLYSTAGYYNSIINPAFHKEDDNSLFIDITGFMGDKNALYNGVDQYIKKSMNPENLIPKISMIYAEQLVPTKMDRQKFLDQIIYNGKIQILQDAFLPDTPDHLKMNYTEEQDIWNQGNEANIWNFFVENDLLFSSDPKLAERFIAPAPFSKFYTEVDNESSPQVGIWIGWQICKNYMKDHKDIKLQEFLNKAPSEIFEQTTYKPKPIN